MTDATDSELAELNRKTEEWGRYVLSLASELEEATQVWASLDSDGKFRFPPAEAVLTAVDTIRLAGEAALAGNVSEAADAAEGETFGAQVGHGPDAPDAANPHET